MSTGHGRDGTDGPVPGRQHFHDRIASLQRAVLAIGVEVRRSIPEATEAWLRRDAVAASMVDNRTTGWSARARDVELTAYELIATQQPMALDLRQLTALVRLSDEVSRSGDLVAHVARSACFDRDPAAFGPRLRARVVEMSALAARLFGDALRAYEEADPFVARLVTDADRDLDRLHSELYATLLDAAADHAPAIDMALLGRFYERLGDHAVEIARQAGYVAAGEVPEDEPTT